MNRLCRLTRTFTIRRGQERVYYITLPVDIAQIEKVSLQWNYNREFSKPDTWFVNPTIYVSQVILEPTYISSDR